MRLRALAKRHLYGSVPLFRGRFPYYEHTVHFPLGCSLFKRACAEGIYERENTNLILSLAVPGTTYFDVGANIGLLSVPVLAAHPSVKVISIEASPNTLSFLRKTHAASRRREDWTIIGAAIGASNGEGEFWSGPVALGAFDGLRDTGRGGPKCRVQVPVRALDDIWQEQGHPPISLIKMDIEGGEYFALKGALNIIARAKPVFIIEWTEMNLASYSIDPDALLQLCAAINYAPYAGHNLVRIDTKPILRLAMAQTETFLLVPHERIKS